MPRLPGAGESHFAVTDQSKPVAQHPEYPLFIHSDLDELRLSMVQFRMYCHLARRGETFSAIETTAEICCTSPDTAWKALSDLVAFGMVERISRPGHTSKFKLTPQSSWKLDAIHSRRRRTPTGNSRAPETAGHPVNSSDTRPANSATGTGNNGVTPTGNSRAQSYSPEVAPLKLLPEGTPPASDLPELVFQEWNKQDKLPKARALTALRRRRIEKLLREPTWRENWKEAIQRAGKSDFVAGNGASGWRGDFDWFLKPDSVLTIVEGRYDNQDHLANPPRPGGSQTQPWQKTKTIEALQEKRRCLNSRFSGTQDEGVKAGIRNEVKMVQAQIRELEGKTP